jgi:aminomethyltransferase
MLKRTPLYEIHISLGARMTTFAGWEMPLEYSGIIDEHLAVRSAVGIFDISHLGQIELSGPKAMDAIQIMTTNDASRLTDGQVQYNLICNPSGGTLDDVTLYRFNENRFMFCINAVNKDKVYNWLREHTGNTAEVRDRSSEYATFALQGPFSEKALQRICDTDLSRIKYYRFAVCSITGVEAIVSRTGYTGEDGFEIYIPASAAKDVWQGIVEAGDDNGIKPAGLGARDSLRLEMGYPLYGNDISEDTTPLEAGLERFVKFLKPSFIGKDALLKQAREEIKKKLTGFEMVGRGIPRSHYPIHAEGRRVGDVTSGGHSPSLNKFIGMGYVDTAFASVGQRIEIEIRGKMLEAEVVPRPFYKR